MTERATISLMSARAHKPMPTWDLSFETTLDRGNAPGRATRELLMTTAERLLADRGVQGVSLREIGLAAGQRNNNVIAYHFGDRAGLVGAIYAFRSERIDNRRFELLAELGGGGAAADLHTLLRIVVQPHAETIADPDNHFLGLLARLMLDVGSIATSESASAKPFTRALHLLRERIRVQVVGISTAVFDRRFDMLFNFAITEMAVQKRLGEAGGNTPPDSAFDEVIDDVVAIMAAGLTAPPSGLGGGSRVMHGVGGDGAPGRWRGR